MKDTNPSHAPCSSENLTTQYTSWHARRKQCGLANFLHNYNIPVFFFIHQERKQLCKAIIYDGLPQSVATMARLIPAHLGW